MLKRTLLFSILMLSLAYTGVKAQDARSILHQVFDQIDRAQTMTYTLSQFERLKGGKETYAKTAVRLQVSPYKLYLKTISPDEGIEVLWREGVYGGKAFINPNGFPYMNVKLDPVGATMLDGQHNPVMNSGFTIFKDILLDAERKADGQGGFDQVFSLNGSTTFDGRDCYVMELSDPTFDYTSATVKAGENVYTMSLRLKVCPYLIMEKNSSVSDYYDVSAGQSLRVPTSYASYTKIYIDKSTMLPIKMELSDERGLFEKYDFLDLVVNPGFPADEFTEDCPRYGF